MEKIRVDKNNNLLENARTLRKNMTPQEKHLWYDFLRYYPIKIYKQRIIGNYIADFYCSAARIVIEIDGAQHFTSEGRLHDEARTETLNRYGLEVLRFTNSDVDYRFDAVCSMIDKMIMQRIKEE